MNFPRGLPAALIGAAATVALVQPQMALALEPSEISAKAKEITVRINGPESGSGVIVERTGTTYSVLTNRHVVDTEGQYQITAPDGQKYPVPYRQVKYLPDVDLAVLQFTSNQRYPTAQLGNSDAMTEGNKVYVVGWADPFPGIPEPSYMFLEAKITSRLQKSEKGYAIVHDNPATPGTSGGPVLDSNARLVGINGRFTSEPNTGKTFGLGIPLQIFLAARNNLVTPGGIAPPEDFVSRGQRLAKAGDYRGAIAEYNKALESDANNFEAYYRRGEAYYWLNDFQAAIADFDRVLRLNSNNAVVYFYRGYARGELKDYQAAISDYNQAIRLNPNLAEAYNNRGEARRNQGDYQAAISDYNEAIRLNPNYAYAYSNRGVARADQGDYQAAISDYNEAIRLNPNYAYAYYNRGLAHRQLGDKQRAIADFQKAAELYRQQGSTNDCQDALDRIRELQQ